MGYFISGVCLFSFRYMYAWFFDLYMELTLLDYHPLDLLHNPVSICIYIYIMLRYRINVCVCIRESRSQKTELQTFRLFEKSNDEKK